MKMVGTAYFRPGKGKCPVCGNYGEENEETEKDEKICPVCNTRFNKYIILQGGQKQKMKNN